MSNGENYNFETRRTENETRARLAELGKVAADMARIIEAELSGKRDGDGTWHGSDPIHWVMNDAPADVRRICNEIDRVQNPF